MIQGPLEFGENIRPCLRCWAIFPIILTVRGTTSFQG